MIAANLIQAFDLAAFMETTEEKSNGPSVLSQ